MGYVVAKLGLDRTLEVMARKPFVVKKRLEFVTAHVLEPVEIDVIGAGREPSGAGLW